MSSRRIHILLALGLPVTAVSAMRSIAMSAPYPERRDALRAPSTTRHDGPAVAVGEGKARTYVITDTQTGVPTEIGVALDERALDGLPAQGSGHAEGHVPGIQYNLELPKAHGTPFTFLEMNWNPTGHPPEGVWLNVPHFDFHFYVIPPAERDAILPTSADFAARANRLPPHEFRPPHAILEVPDSVPPVTVAVPMMGVHWVDERTPELQRLLGRPEAYRPFTKTFIHGSWDGRFIFWEPMITRAYLLEKKTTRDPAVRDEVIALPTPARYQVPGRYPRAYRIAWDPTRREYRIALTELVQRD